MMDIVDRLESLGVSLNNSYSRQKTLNDASKEIQTLRAKLASADLLVAELEVALRKVQTNLKRPIKTVHGSLIISFAFVDEAIATYDKLSESNIMEKSLSLAKSQLNNYKKLSEVKHDTNK